jgi:hypothetical protein
MTIGFVHTTNLSALSPQDLSELIKHYMSKESWYFLRWPDQVSHFKPGLPSDFCSSNGKGSSNGRLCTEGQVFSQTRELRWQRRGDSYSVLLLSKTEVEHALQTTGQTWTAVGSTWETKDLPANFYPETETRFPKGLNYPDKLDIGQRYFIDAQTALVQFVALRVV